MAFSDSVNLLFSIRADGSDASQELKQFSKLVDSETKNIEGSGNSAFNSLSKSIGLSAEQTATLSSALPIAGAAIAGVAAAAVGAGAAIFALAKNASDFGSSIKDFQDKTGLAAETITTLKFNAEQSGVAFNSLSTPIAKFTKLLYEAEQGSDKAANKLAKFGITNFNDLDGSLAKAISKIHDAGSEVDKSGLAMDAFGAKSGTVMRAVADNVDGNLNKAIETAKRLGVTLSEDDVKAADDFGDTFHTVSLQVQGALFKIAKEYMPLLTAALSDISGYLAENKATFSAWGTTIGNIIEGTISRFEKLKAIIVFLRENAASGFVYGVNQEALAKAQQSIRDADAPAELRRQYGNVVRASSDDFTPLRIKKKITDAGDELADGIKSAGKAVKATLKELLPASGDGFTSYKRNASEEFGTPEAIDNLKLIASTFKDLTGKIISIGDGSRADQKQFGPHKGHRDLETFDVRPVRKDGANLPVSINDSQYDQAATRALIELIKKVVPGALIRFNDADFVREGLTRKTTGHDDHLDLSHLGGKGNLVNLKKIEEDKIKDLKKDEKDAEDKRAKGIKDIEDANQKISQLDAAQAQTSLALLDSLLSQKLIKEDEYTRQVGEIKLRQLETEKQQNEKLLKNPGLSGKETTDLQNKNKILDEQITRQKLENADKTREGIKKVNDEYANQIKILNNLKSEVLKGEIEVQNFRKEQERKVLENQLNASSGKERITALIVLREFDVAEAERRKTQIDAQAADEKAAAEKEIGNAVNKKERLVEIDKLYKNRLLISEEEFQAHKAEIESRKKLEIQQANIDASGGGFLGGVLQSAGIGAETLNAKLTPLKTIGNIIGGQFNAIAGAVGNAVQAFVLYGNAGASVKKVTAQIIASIAQQSAVQAIYELAQGLAVLALAFFGVPNAGPSASAHFAAAATFGLVAGVTAVAGRAVAGDSFKNQTASNSFNNQTAGGGNYDFRNNNSNGNSRAGAYSPFGDTVQKYDEERSRRQEILVKLQVQSNDSHIVKTIHENILDRGKLHGLIVEVAG